METARFKDSIKAITHDLLFHSESEYPIELVDLGCTSPDGITELISREYPDTQPETISASQFFEHTINSLKASREQILLDEADRYQKLQQLLQANTLEVKVLRAGVRRIGIYICIVTKQGHVLLLKTISIET